MSPATTLPPARRAYWRSFRLFGDLDPEVLSEIEMLATARHWDSGQVLFRRGEAGESVVGVTSGRVNLSVVSASGRELILRQAGPGDLLGELAMFDGGLRSADATAIGPVVGWELNRERFFGLADRYPKLYGAALRHVSGMLRETTEQLEGIALYQLEARVARFILVTLATLHGDDLPDRAELRLGPTQGDLAQLLGASRPKVNRVLQSFREKGVLTDSGSLWLCDVAMLRTLAEPND